MTDIATVDPVRPQSHRRAMSRATGCNWRTEGEQGSALARPGSKRDQVACWALMAARRCGRLPLAALEGEYNLSDQAELFDVR